MEGAATAWWGVILASSLFLCFACVFMCSGKRNHDISEDSRKWRASWYRYLDRRDAGQMEEKGAQPPAGAAKAPGACGRPAGSRGALTALLQPCTEERAQPLCSDRK